MTVLFLNHQEQKCGVYQMGRRIGHALRDGMDAMYLETWDLGTAILWASNYAPSAIIYNWHPSTMPWATEVVRRHPAIKHIGLIHEIAPDAPHVGAEIFPFRMVCDPTFPADGRTVFRSVRHVPRFAPGCPPHEWQGSRCRWCPAERATGFTEAPSITVGSFGFAVGGKQFATVVHAVGAEFPCALVRLRIPAAHYGDAGGDMARRLAQAAQAVSVGGVRVAVEHEFLAEDQLVAWLSANDMNVFFYEPNGGRGISSVIDYAIAAQRPIAVNRSQMFRHVHDRLGMYPTTSLASAFEQNAEAVRCLYNEWTTDRLVEDYQQMLRALGAA